MANIFNTASNTLLSGTSSADSIYNGGRWDSLWHDSGSKVTIDAGAGKDKIYNYGSNSSISAGAGNDYIENDGDNLTINAGGGDDSIETYGDMVSIDGGAGNDTVWNDYDSNVTINGGVGNDIIRNSGSDITIDAGAGNDSIRNSGSKVTIDAGAGKDKIYNYGSNSSISAGAGNDYMLNGSDGDSVSIDAGAGNDSIENYGSNVTIDGGADNDSLSSSNWSGAVSMNGSAGNDTLYTRGDGNKTLTGGTGSDLFIYNPVALEKDDAFNDIITDYAKEDTIRFVEAVKKVSTNSSGSVVFTFAEYYNKLVVKNAADKVVTYIDADGSTKTFGDSSADEWKLDDSTATYGSLVVKGVTSLDGLSLNGKILTVSAASLGTEKISVSDGYTLALGDDVKASTTKKSWTLKNSTASYKQTTTAGYELDDNEIIYSKKSSKTLAKVTGVKSLDGLSVNKKIVTVSAASLGTEKISVSDGYSLALGDDVKASTTKKSWTLKNSTATYKQITSAGYSLVDNEIIYSKKSSKTLATVKGVNDKSGLKVSGKTIKLSGDALSKKVTVSGDYVFDFASDFKNATITGSSSNDTIIARGKNIFVTGGAGADIFEFKSTGTVSDYEEADKISLSSAANISVSGSDVIFNKKITVAGAAEKIVTYIEDGAEKTFAAPAPYNEGVTLAANYAEDSFTANATVVTIDASAVLQPLEIFGNKKANVITGSDEDDYIDGGTGADKIFGRDGNDTLIGGKGNDSLSGGKGDDSLWGGAGTDTLRGGSGSDIFVYTAGDGKIFIEDFDDSLDKIRVLSGSVYAPESDGTDVTFAVDDGQIIIKGGASKYIPIYFGEGNKNIVQKYIPRN